MELLEQLIGRSPPEDWMVVYDLFADSTRLRHMQETSLAARTDAGLDPNPLVGSADWIAEIQDGRRPVHCVSGVIGRVYWGSMADYPEFTIVASENDESSLSREGDVRLYVPGIGVQLFYVDHAWKKELRKQMGEHRQVQLAIWLERSPQRSSAIAPGPGGAGYQLARRTGDVVHYLLFPNATAAQQAVTNLDGTGLRVKPWIAATIRGWYVECWSADDATDQEIRRLAEFAASVGGEYDGGERVEGPVWGPTRKPVDRIVTGTGGTKTLFRPVGQAELDLIERSGWRRFPPRLPGQPIFYPVLNAEYATTIARDWNTKDGASGHVGYVLRFEVEAVFAARYPVQRAGGAMCEELWVPAEELDEFNDHIRGLIVVVAEYRAED